MGGAKIEEHSVYNVDHKVHTAEPGGCVGGAATGGVYKWGGNRSMACTTWTTRSILQNQVG